MNAQFLGNVRININGCELVVALLFLDDVLVLGTTPQDHLVNLREVFEQFRQFGMKFKPKKSELFCSKVGFLGRTVSAEGVKMGNQYIEAAKEWPVPTDTKGVEIRKLPPKLHFRFFAYGETSV
jgi:hypothetical protein